MEKPKFQFGKTEKEKKIALLILAIVIAVLYFQVLLRPGISKLAGELWPKVSNLRSSLGQANTLIVNRQMIERERDRLAELTRKHEEIFPAEHEIPKLLESLSKIAGESDVKLIAVKPLEMKAFGPEGLGDVYQEIPIEIEAISGYHQFGEFLAKLETGKRFMMIRDLTITSDKENTKRHRITLTAITYALIKKE
jgi:type IV pilus assembly protein PilO